MTKFPKKNRLAASALALLLLMLAQACIEMDKTVGEDFIPPNQQLQLYMRDATGFFTMQTVALDSMSTSNFNAAVLGRMDDPRFGKTTAGFAVQLLPATYTHTFEEGVTGFDSVVLILGFSSTYGSDKTPMDVEVYELSADLSESETYYGTPSVAESLSNMATNLAVGADSINAASVTARIKLTDNNNLFSRLFSHTNNADSFLTNFKGVYVRAGSGAGGSIKSVSMVNTSSEYAASALVAFYHYTYTDPNDEVVKDSVTSFTFHSFSATPRFNVFWHDSSLLQGAADMLYMQGLAGVATQMTISKDSVEAWTGIGDKEKHYAISRAELVLHVVDTSDYAALDMYSTQLQCIVEASSRENGKYAAIWDMYASDGSFSSSFDGALNRSLMQYSLNITHYFNDVVKGNIRPLLIVPYAYTSDARSVLIDNKNVKPRLKITYVEIKD